MSLHHIAKTYELYNTKPADGKEGIEYFYQGSEEIDRSIQFTDPDHPFLTAGIELAFIAASVRNRQVPANTDFFDVLQQGTDIRGNEMIAASKKGVVPDTTVESEQRSNAIFLLLHERFNDWLHKYGLPNNEDLVFMDEMVELALEFEFIYDYYFQMHYSVEQEKIDTTIAMRESHQADAIVEMSQQQASKFAHAFLHSRLEQSEVNVLHFPQPHDLRSTMWAETNFIFKDNTVIRPCANHFKPCMNMIASSEQITCSDTCSNTIQSA